MVNAVVTTPTIVRTIAKLRLGARAFQVVEPDLSLASAVPFVQRTPIASTTSAQLLCYLSLQPLFLR